MTRCIACSSINVEQFFDLGKMALANRFLAEKQLLDPEPVFPLRVGFCRNCTHVQLMEFVSPMTMFDNYLYVSSASDTLRNHLYSLARTLTERYHLSAKDLVVDIGSNDGTLLSEFIRRGTRTLGVDPARNLAELASRVGVVTHPALFGAESARQIVAKYGKARLVTATNTFLHIPELADFMKGLDTVLEPEGSFVIEFHYLMDLLDQCAFDTIYHEHVSYWALKPLAAMFERYDMQVVDVERLPIHHGQLRVFIHRKGHLRPRPSVEALLHVEKSMKMDEIGIYQDLKAAAERIRVQLCRSLDGFRREGKRVAGYGAPAKGNTLLNYFGIGPDRVEYVVDRSTLKQGLYTPGMHIPIVPPSKLIDDRPDYLLLLAWNFADEIMAQQEGFRTQGGKFVIPVPNVRVL